MNSNIQGGLTANDWEGYGRYINTCSADVLLSMGCAQWAECEILSKHISCHHHSTHCDISSTDSSVIGVQPLNIRINSQALHYCCLAGQSIHISSSGGTIRDDDYFRWREC